MNIFTSEDSGEMIQAQKVELILDSITISKKFSASRQNLNTNYLKILENEESRQMLESSWHLEEKDTTEFLFK